MVCGAVSCPTLAPEAYGWDLDRVLDERMKAFVHDKSRNFVDDGAKRLRLSQVFEWYADDFGGKEKVAAYISRYLGRDVSGYGVAYFGYSWDLNIVSDRK